MFGNVLPWKRVGYWLDDLYNSLLFTKKLFSVNNILLCNQAVRTEIELSVAIIKKKKITVPFLLVVEMLRK